MRCPRCDRVVRPGNTRGRDENITERRYYCSCGFVHKTAEQVVVTWKKTIYTPRVPVVEVPVAEVAPVKRKRGRPRKNS